MDHSPRVLELDRSEKRGNRAYAPQKDGPEYQTGIFL